MTKAKKSIKIFSVNQMCCYQVLIEAFNIIKNVASDTLYKEWMHQDIRRYVEVACHYTSLGHALLPKVVHFRAFVMS